MSSRGILYDLLKGVWNNLGGEKRFCWKVYADKHPIASRDGNLYTLYPWQMFYRTNAWLAVASLTLVLEDPPTFPGPPSAQQWQATEWATKFLDAAGHTHKKTELLLQVPAVRPLYQFEIVTQGYTRNHRGPPLPMKPTHTQEYKDPRPRHVRVIEEGFFGVVDLKDPNGYFATTLGRPKFSNIVGPGVRAHPGYPAGRLISVSTLNGSLALGVVMRATEDTKEDTPGKPTPYPGQAPPEDEDSDH